MFSIRFNRWTIAAVAFTALALPGSWSQHIPFSMFLLSVGAASLVVTQSASPLR